MAPRRLLHPSLVALHAIVSAALLLSAGATNVLFSGMRLGADEALVNGPYALTMREDCNLVLYHNGSVAPLWESESSRSAASCYLQVTDYGELLIVGLRRSEFVPVWENGRWSSIAGRFALVLRDDGRLVVYGPQLWYVKGASSPPPSAAGEDNSTAIPAATAVMISGARAQIGTVVANGGYKMALQEDCNLVVWSAANGGRITWQSGTGNAVRDCYVALDSRGELSIRYMGGKILWTRGVNSLPGEYVLAINPWGAFAVFGPPVWRSPRIGVAVEGTKKTAMAASDV